MGEHIPVGFGRRADCLRAQALRIPVAQINGWEPSLEIQLRRGLNARVGERCPGNATVVDALKLVLQDSAGDLARPLYRANHATA